jgi:flavin-dependent dehydrogenase
MPDRTPSSRSGEPEPLIEAEPSVAEERSDVVVVGAGIAGLAAARHLAAAGLAVTCVDPDPFPRLRVGESLDWSTPRLLEEVGVSWQSLVDDGAAVFKRGIQVQPVGEESAASGPSDWLGRAPLRFGVVTFHADRREMDRRLYESARQAGVRFVWERASDVEVDGDGRDGGTSVAGARVRAVTTTAGRRLAADWFVDSSGRGARLLGRRLGVPTTEYGPAKVCLWTYFETGPEREGTTFYVDSAGEPYLSWLWEIPIRPGEVSLGWVLDAATVAAAKRRGRSPRELLAEHLARFPRPAALLASRPDFELHCTSFTPYSSRRACGANWFLAGEAAAVPDPLTSNGVTAALRHARLAARSLLAARRRGRGGLGRVQRWVYDESVRSMALAFNRAIETSIYRSPLRHGLGTVAALRVYTTFGYLANAFHTRFDPRRAAGVATFGLAMRGVPVWMGAWSLLGRLVGRLRPRPAPA